jgi:hypothetical protein
MGDDKYTIIHLNDYNGYNVRIIKKVPLEDIIKSIEIYDNIDDLNRIIKSCKDRIKEL